MKAQPALPVPEKDFQRAVVDLAHLRGWLVHHTRPAMNRRGRWASPLQGDAGCPDLVLMRGGHHPGCVLAELKSERGELTFAQRVWLWTSAFALGLGHVFLWRPSSWHQVEATLR